MRRILLRRILPITGDLCRLSTWLHQKDSRVNIKGVISSRVMP